MKSTSEILTDAIDEALKRADERMANAMNYCDEDRRIETARADELLGMVQFMRTLREKCRGYQGDRLAVPTPAAWKVYP